MISYLRNPRKPTEHLLKTARRFNKQATFRMYMSKSIQENTITTIKSDPIYNDHKSN